MAHPDILSPKGPPARLRPPQSLNEPDLPNRREDPYDEPFSHATDVYTRPECPVAVQFRVHSRHEQYGAPFHVGNVDDNALFGK